MDKKIKTLIAEKKLTDEFILSALNSALTADNPDADEDLDDTTDDASEVEEIPTIEEEESEEVDDSDEQPDIEVLVEQKVREVLNGMKKGKKAPIPKRKAKPTTQTEFYNQFGTI